MTTQILTGTGGGKRSHTSRSQPCDRLSRCLLPRRCYAGRARLHGISGSWRS